ncbi:MAG: chemotaxis-specific protein-glutamate methyltransferase CheB [Deltaproteobacteria bacterium]|nr:chemotaxis-specific protein-glutamate methyltransferase CheB [Deltaproteobacteria bacterium]
MPNQPIRLLIIDDSAYNRKTIADFFVGSPKVQVVGKAADGQEGLKMALNLAPSVITLDLEMPRLDGFGFLRILMSGQPTPVIVVSSHGQKENVFRALELGALDFVVKPSTMISPSIRNIREDVIQKVMAAGKFNLNALQNLSSGESATGLIPIIGDLAPGDQSPTDKAAEKVVVIGASTGGPASITKILSSLPPNLSTAIVVAQHMPAQFTATFAARLNRLFPLRVLELQQGQIIKNGTVYITPGDSNLKFSKSADGYFLEKSPLSDRCRYAPSIDRIFISAAETVKTNLLGVVLTGMGDDGALGCEKIHGMGGSLLVESEETAIVYGMPQSVLERGLPAKKRPLHMIAGAIASFAKQ